MTDEELSQLLSDAKQHLAYASADCAECSCPGCAFGHDAAVDVEAAIDALTAKTERLQALLKRTVQYAVTYAEGTGDAFDKAIDEARAALEKQP